MKEKKNICKTFIMGFFFKAMNLPQLPLVQQQQTSVIRVVGQVAHFCFLCLLTHTRLQYTF